ncbi:MAG: 30S ribosomal protein S13 [Omnitrophica bacterium RIFCSPLOWO2_12_FULL_44_17]|uniref:Small ribosomal subunit protein uS13 n=1 Tax=Candidatus Danuiimicrobium aquiferis TaxID=1801832 RepID=A0A1G1L019_9BACT|nr:MAG: 30S ribosomal protein S13 [Omnitrophica bacterium RIFCSPHIGHO2_02_FULL_45_28]OGW90896.1 MAG: 30S ribosomal protein S13 [Omnitrophica bacterium RIFCSPHIGHO2_12_FULL_44_12]OGW98487.1 MAG: 30S ribosomal protein S13 [Omnitrophica bacterium RIFCSPLOWO2_12_FULL_44_17]
MPRIFGIDIPREKRMEIALTYLQGIGRTLSNKVLAVANIDINKRAKDLTEKEIADITSIIQKMDIKVEGDLRREIQQHIKRLVDIKCYRGSRHIKGLPVRGQRSHTNARTRKGPRRTIGGLNRKPPSPK